MQKETIYLASDHAGCLLKAAVCTHLAAAGYQIVDLGPDQGESVDYPDYGVKLAMALKDDTAARGCGRRLLVRPKRPAYHASIMTRMS